MWKRKKQEQREEDEKTQREKDTSSPEKSGQETRIVGAVETENYDFVPEFPPSDGEDELAEKEGIEADYSYRGEDIREGLRIFQKATIYRKNLIYTLILAIIFVIYIINFSQQTTQLMPAFLAVLCVAVIVMLWMLPYNHVRKVAEATDASPEMKFHMAVYDTCIRIAEEKGSFILHYGKEINRTFETRNLFLFCVGKERVFMLPKRFLEKEQQNLIRAMLENGMKDGHADKRDSK